MPEESSSFPQRPQTHVTGEAALSAFKFMRPQDWAISESKSDYGWDIYVEIPESGLMKGLAFSLQLKGTESLRLINNDSQVSFSLEVSTINFLLAKLEPSMIAVCDTAHPEQPVFWVWLKEAIDQVKSDKPDWQNQKSVSIRLPSSNKLTRSIGSNITDYVRKHYENIRVGQAVSEVLGLGSDSYSSPETSTYRGEPERYVKEQLLPHLSAAGIVETFDTVDGETTEALTPADQARNRRLREISLFLGKLQDREAEKVLGEIETDIPSSSDGIRARYWNCKGVLALHKYQDHEALDFFEKALELRPYDQKYLTNSLFSELHIQSRSFQDRPITMPPDWAQRLETLLQQHPDFSPAIRLKAIWLSQNQGPEAAEDFLSNSQTWNIDSTAMRECAAEIYKDFGNNRKALSLVEEVESLIATHEPTFWGLKAFILMRLALDDTSTAPEFQFNGYGPKQLNLTYLRNSFDTYLKAIAGYREAGFPLLSEPALTNFTAVAGLLHRPEASEAVCRQFLEYHPKNASVAAALASSLLYQGNPQEAASILRTVHQAHPESERFFKNLALCQMAAEEYEDLLTTVKKREATGFLSLEEEGIARSLAAVSLSELGEQSRANEQIDLLKKKPGLSDKGFVAEADAAWRTNRDPQQVLEIYKRGLSTHPTDSFLQTMFALQVRASTPETAKETVPILESLDLARQLAPEEFLLLVRGLLVLDQPEKAATALQRAVNRYPEDARFLFEQSSVQWMLGDEESAFQYIQEYLKREKSYHALRECALLARDTGRLDDAIKLFELASRKATSSEDKAGIQSQLYILKKLRKDPPKDILRHAYEYGRTTEQDPEKDAQYFMMFLTAPGGANIDDPEIKTWCLETQTRIQEFSALHPQFHSFKTFTVDKSRPVADQFRDAITDIIAETLPRELATTPLRMAARSQNFPLVVRAKYYPGIHSAFELWERCTKSNDFEYAIHIWSNENNPAAELAAAEKSKEVCIDITGLLTLAELNLLNLFAHSFDRIYLARGTKQLLAVQQASLEGLPPLAEKIENWRLENITRIRIRAAKRVSRKAPSGRPSGDGALILSGQETSSIDNLLGDGVGESLLLSRRLGIPLYSDESSVRIWAASEYGVDAFSTLTFLRLLQHSSQIGEIDCIRIQSELIKRNFRSIPFTAKHLLEPLKQLIREQRKGINYAQLLNHPILHVYLKEFGESGITLDSLARVAREWWFAIVLDPELPNECLLPCMEGTSRALALWRTCSGVLATVEDEPEQRAAALWASFLWLCYRRDEDLIPQIWKYVKECCSNIFQDQYEKQRTVLFDKIPKVLYDIVSKEPGLSLNQKLTLYVSLPWKLHAGDPDISELEKRFVRYSQKLSRQMA